MATTPERKSSFRPNLDIFGVPRRDPGWIYLVRNMPGGDRFKIGKTTSPKTRLKSFRTLLPDMEEIAVKPFWNISHIERSLMTAFCWSWLDREWFKFSSESDRDLLIEGLCEFYEEDRDMNSVDFIYWFNSSGMAEFAMERASQKLTLPKWLKQESGRSKTRV
jgi:T5orf172 domain